MHVIKITVSIVFLFWLTGCASLGPPVISDISDEHVKVERPGTTSIGSPSKDMMDGSVEKEANRGCALYNRVAVPISHACVRPDVWFCYRWRFLFACKDPE